MLRDGLGRQADRRKLRSSQLGRSSTTTWPSFGDSGDCGRRLPGDRRLQHRHRLPNRFPQPLRLGDPKLESSSGRGCYGCARR